MKSTFYTLLSCLLLISSTAYAQLDLDFETDRGFYDTPFNLELTVNDPAANIRYTTNGTAPTTTTGTVYTSPIPINTTANIRAIAYTNTDTTKVLTHTYLFVDDVLNQPDTIIGYPRQGLAFDSTIVHHSTYGGQLRDALLQVPSISVIMDLDSMNSVYNTQLSFRVSPEHAASVEFLYPNGDAVQENCGIERFGGTSFNNPKRNFRLTFKDIYGAGKLDYPILGKEVSDEFDQIALRAGHAGCMNVEGTWRHTGESNDIADQVIRDLQINMQPDGIGVAGKFMHLYLNGVYWGVYNAHERPKDGWAQKYYGGEKEDWDIIKKKAALSGTEVAWDTLNYMADSLDLSIPANYEAIQKYIDVEQFIDYVIITNYAPHSDNHPSGKNSMLTMNRTDSVGFKFWIWDSEPALDYYWPPSWQKDHVGHRVYANILASLQNNSDFMTSIGDRVECHCFNDGALSPGKAIEAYMDVYNSTDVAMIAEAGRWARDTAYMGFIDAKDRITGSYMVTRADTLVWNYTNAGLYPTISAVQFSQYGGEVASGYALTLTNPNANGTIYYTTDGTDPRASGGGISASAQAYSGAITMPDGVTEVKARVLIGTTWSAACPRRFYTDIDYNNLVINEIMYHADDTCSANASEMDYIEIHNKGTKAISLADTKFTCGIKYVFNQNTIIAPGDYLVLAENIDTFNLHYGFMPHGQYAGGLSNDGETIVYENFKGEIIDMLTYNDVNPWDEAPDGGGYSLELLDPDLDNADPLSWFRSDDLCGTPGAPNSRTCTGTADAIVINEINYNSDNGISDPGDWVELYNPNSIPVNISNWTFYDNGNEFSIPSGTIMQPDEYLVLTENDTMFTTIFPHLTPDVVGNFGFKLSNKGERISLFDRDKCLSDYVVYNDKLPWDTIPDGNGPTLSLITPNSDNTLAPSWESSSNINSAYGTPGRANEPCLENVIEFPSVICAGFPTEIKVDSAYSDMDFTWNVSGATPNNFTLNSETLTWNNPGTYNVQLITKHYECTKVYSESITVNDCNTAPNIVDDNYSTNEDNSLTDNVLSNDSDPNNDGLTVDTTPVNDVTNGTLILNPDGTFDYTPNPNFYGTDSFTYQVCDDATFINDQTVSVSVAASGDDVEELTTGIIETGSSDLDLMNDAPDNYSAIGLRLQNITVPQGANISNAYLELVADEAQSEATTLTISAEATGNAAAIPTTNFALTSMTKTSASATWANLPAWTIGQVHQSSDLSNVIQEIINRPDWASGNAMTLLIEGTGRRTAESFDGVAAPKLVIEYQHPIDVSLCETATVTINITPENDTPIAEDDVLGTSEESPVTGNVLINDFDVENAAGTCGINITQVLAYGGAQDNGTATILDNGATIMLENNAWKAIPFQYTITSKTVIEFDFKSTEEAEFHDIGMDNNFGINNGRRFKLYGTESASNVQTDFHNYDGSGDYQHYSIPIGQYNGGDRNYIFFNVDSDANPTIGNSYFSNICVYEDLNGNGINDETNMSVTTSLITPPANGAVTIDGAGIYTYTPDPDFYGTDTFEYEICDNGSPALCDIARVTIEVNPVNDAPIPAPDTLYMFANSTIQDNVLVNDVDIENDNLTAAVTLMIAPINGSVTIQANGNIDYTPDPNFVGTDSFMYEVCDDGTPSMCATETVTVTIEPDCVDIELHAWLEGAYDPTLGEMTTTLSTDRKLLPGQTPVSTFATPTPAGQPYSLAPWNYAGTEGATWTDSDYTGDETDWVLVSFRTGIEKNTEVSTTAGLLMKDGSISFPDRCALTSTVTSPLYIVLEHRNHIGIMTENPVSVTNSTLTYDFRLANSFNNSTGFGQKQLPTGEWVMYAGDADQSDFPSYDITGSDKNIWTQNNGIFDYYYSPDFNLDGDINGQDKNIWERNNGISSRVPK